MDPDKKTTQRPDEAPLPESDGTVNTCLRCGTCCQKGGPGLHQQDRALIEKGRIPAKYLYTIRKGEPVYDNVKGCLVTADADIIKVRGRGDKWTCTFFDADKKGCRIYNDRPLECRLLKCWDTAELERMYSRQRLTRRDLMARVDGLWELVSDHQARCDYGKIKTLIDALDGPRMARARRQLGEIIQYDAEIRKLAVAKGGLDPEMLDFVFGRALIETLPHYGIRIRLGGGKTTISRSR